MALVRGAPQLLVETDFNGGLGYEDRLGRTVPVARKPFLFAESNPRLLASLSASSTAACTSGVVTVTATAHGIVATAFDGFEFYYPGSPSLAAGWYAGFTRTSADACTFSAPLAADFTSESINSGAAMVGEITVASIVLPPYTMMPGDIVRAILACNQDGTTNTKTQRIRLGGVVLCSAVITTATSSYIGALSFSVISNTKHFGVSREHNLSSTEIYGTVDISTSLTLSVTNQLSAAGSYTGLSSLKLDIA